MATRNFVQKEAGTIAYQLREKHDLRGESDTDNPALAVSVVGSRTVTADELAKEIAARLPAGVPVLFVEEEIRAGGFGMMLTDALRRNGGLAGHPNAVLAIANGFVTQGKNETILRTAGVDAEAMTAAIKGLLGQ